MTKNLIAASVVALAIAGILLSFSIKAYVTWHDIPVENHAKLVMAFKTAIFLVFPAVSFACIFIGCILISSLRKFPKSNAHDGKTFRAFQDAA